MATIRITNIGSAPYLPTMFMATPPAIAPGAHLDITDRSPYDAGNDQLMQDQVDGLVAVTVTLSPAEISSGLLVPPSSLSGDDIAPVPAATILAANASLRAALVAGVAGTPDDVTIYAVNTLPFKIRILDVVFFVATAIDTETLQLRTAAAGGGTLIAAATSGAAGAKLQGVMTTTAVVAPGALVGLFVRRSDRGLGGEVVVHFRRES
jgi:hypothetical protein